MVDARRPLSDETFPSRSIPAHSKQSGQQVIHTMTEESELIKHVCVHKKKTRGEQVLSCSFFRGGNFTEA